ncbi:MAG: ChaN family lipoprotein [Hyphomicrobium sp.]|nr:ChaN family lipoprotein [Hyphomicrobium sp.]
MRYLKLLSLVGLTVFFAILVLFSPPAPLADVKAHPLCEAVLTYAAVDSCLMYDTGRTTGKPKLSTPHEAQDLVNTLALGDGPDVLVLGEAHDNPHHHKLRSTILTANAKAIVMEQLRADQNDGIASFNTENRSAARPATLDDFKKRVDWAKGGWDKYPIDPLLEAVIATRTPIYAGDPPRDTIRKVAKEGLDALPAAEQARLALDKPLGEKIDAVSAEEIEGSHCGMLPKTAVPRMALAQRYRDAHLADATLKAVSDHGRAILLTGNNHALLDRGVPWYIRARAPDKKVVSIVLVEIEDGKTDPEAYVPRDPDGKPAADYLIFTPTIDREDPCAGFTK